MSFASHLRQELSVQAERYARAEGLPYFLSYGTVPSVCFAPSEDESRHGNFLRASYKAIKARTGWQRRLTKVHTLGKRSLPLTDRGRWMELDSCTSSDALLMNVFCYPGIVDDPRFLALLGTRHFEPSNLCFGYPAKVPLASGKVDRTEVDLQVGDLLIEAKLTESDFQNAPKKVLMNYRDFSEVFDFQELRQTEERFNSYQLLRNVLAAHALQCSFCVLIDERRPDLAEAWYAVMKSVKPTNLRTRLRILTWQEVAQLAPPKLKTFLSSKYGIA